MLRFLPRPIRALVMFLLFVANLVLWAIPVYAMILVKLVTPAGRGRDRVSIIMSGPAQRWARTNVLIGDFMLGTQWDIEGVEKLDMRGQYLVTSNHQTWNDIYVLMKAFARDAPFFKFFLKKQLIWVPILGPVWWALDYPFMQRHSREAIAANPALATQDLEATKRACTKYGDQPVMILNFLEGTRFTRAKHDAQESPYRHLLRPKSGGLVFALQAMGGKLASVLDVTIVYPEGACGFWQFFEGRMKRVIVRVREIRVPEDFLYGDYAADAEFRKRVQAWVSDIWAEKDRFIDELQAQARREAVA
ncbi:acyltransferase [Algiphilus aromaticivorans]|uniref:acyltransferase n=1 Tax=Algiphilus aromaticivorans TaxID=382454 RepID=UPI0005C1BCF5|nr:acyltransferase [Algiphilus aromaticivorans]